MATDLPSGTLLIYGQNFDNGSALAVALGGVPLVAILVSRTEVGAALPAGIPAGDYLLSITTGPAPHQSALFAVTIDAPPPDLTQFYTRAQVDALLQAMLPSKQDGTGCESDRECISGNCVDGVCCDQPCAGNCRSCALAGSVGHCTNVPNGLDPRRACQSAEGGSPACAGACFSGRCSFPDVGTVCGLCSACDGTGRCVIAPADDASCGVIECSGLDTACRIYQDLTGNRCAALGTCKMPNDPATCDLYAVLHDPGCY